MSWSETVVRSSELGLVWGEWPQHIEHDGFSYTFVGPVKDDAGTVLYGLYGCSYGPVLKVIHE